MRLLTHNTMRNNTQEAKGAGYPLRIDATQIVVDDNNDNVDSEQQIAFVKGVMGMLNWKALVNAAASVGLYSLPPELSEDMSKDEEFCKALYHVLMNVHVIQGECETVHNTHHAAFWA
jgi:multifunctional methyltransferase subunit TRM112